MQFAAAFGVRKNFRSLPRFRHISLSNTLLRQCYPLYRYATYVQKCCSEIEQASWGSLGPRIPNSPVVFGSRRFRCSHRDARISRSGGNRQSSEEFPTVICEPPAN